ncbi:Hypothetical predicted protein, partial [Marmota monax]
MRPALPPGDVKRRPGLRHILVVTPQGRPTVGDTGPRRLGPHVPRRPTVPSRPHTLVVDGPGRPFAPVVHASGTSPRCPYTHSQSSPISFVGLGRNSLVVESWDSPHSSVTLRPYEGSLGPLPQGRRQNFGRVP